MLKDGIKLNGPIERVTEMAQDSKRKKKANDHCPFGEKC